MSSDEIFQRICSSIEDVIIIQPEAYQLDLLKVLLELSCTRVNYLTSTRLKSIMNSSLSMILSSSSVSVSIVTAAQAAISQIFQCYSKQVICSNSNQSVVFQEHLISVLDFLCSAILEYQKSLKLTSESVNKLNQASFVISLLLRCIQTILIELTITEFDQAFLDFIR